MKRALSCSDADETRRLSNDGAGADATRSTPAVRAWVGGGWLPWRALGRVGESERTFGGVDARWVYTMRVAGGRDARCFRGCEVD